MVFKLARKVIMNVSEVRKWDTERTTDRQIYLCMLYERTAHTDRDGHTLQNISRMPATLGSHAVGKLVFKRLAKGDGGEPSRAHKTNRGRNGKRINSRDRTRYLCNVHGAPGARHLR